MDQETTSKNTLFAGIRKLAGELNSGFQALPFRLRLVIDIAVILLGIALLLFVTPELRYKLLNQFSSSAASITVLDEQDGQPIIDASVSVGEDTKFSDHNGRVEFGSLPFGENEMTIEKLGYEAVRQNIELTSSNPEDVEIKLKSNGKRVTISVNKHLSDEPLEEFAVVNVGNSNTSAIGRDGQATLVFPDDNTIELSARIVADNYVSKTVNLRLDTEESNIFELVPEGRHFYLDTRGGANTIYQSGFDGNDQSILLQPTGLENSASEIYVADGGQYIAYLASRRAQEASELSPLQLYVVDVNNGSVSEVSAGFKSWQILDINEERVLYMGTLGNPNDSKNSVIYSHNFQTETTIELFSSRNISFPTYVNETIVLAELIERGSYPGGYLLRQLLSVREDTGIETVHTKDATVTEIKRVSPTRVQFTQQNPQTKASVRFAYDSQQNAIFQSSFDLLEITSLKPVSDELLAFSSGTNSTTIGFVDLQDEITQSQKVRVGTIVERVVLGEYAIVRSSEGASLINLVSQQSQKLP